jgi:hypothetical protein
VRWRSLGKPSSRFNPAPRMVLRLTAWRRTGAVRRSRQVTKRITKRPRQADAFVVRSAAPRLRIVSLMPASRTRV